MDEGWQGIVFRADIAGFKTAAKRAKFQGRAYQQASTLGLFEALFIVICDNIDTGSRAAEAQGEVADVFQVTPIRFRYEHIQMLMP